MTVGCHLAFSRHYCFWVIPKIECKEIFENRMCFTVQLSRCFITGNRLGSRPFGLLPQPHLSATGVRISPSQSYVNNKFHYFFANYISTVSLPHFLLLPLSRVIFFFTPALALCRSLLPFLYFIYGETDRELIPGYSHTMRQNPCDRKSRRISSRCQRPLQVLQNIPVSLPWNRQKGRRCPG